MSNLKIRLTVMNFLEFFVWGAWLISLGGYMIVTLKFSGSEVGSIYATMGVASLFMPPVMGIIADRWMNAERVLGICHIIGAILLLFAAQVKDYPTMYLVMLLNSMFYMPTIALNNSVSYAVLHSQQIDVVKFFPGIRVWGTVGFVAAMWVIDLGKWTLSPVQLYVSAAAGLVLGFYAFTLPACPPSKVRGAGSFSARLGLDAFVLFKRSRMAVFFIFAMFLGAALQITNTFGEAFLHDFASSYPDSFAVKHPSILMSVSQISETLFILTIPFFLKRFGIKQVMLMSMVAWVLRFGLFAFGNPGEGFVLLVMSMIIYGMAFDFFNISGSLFVRQEAHGSILSSAQGLFMLMTNGIGAFVGGTISGWVVDYFTTGGARDWQNIWLSFAGYALILALVFPFVFRYKEKETLASTI
ncbi:nucleoside permease [Chryseosolibacter indicus]|uniref:Nucleoside permease n=1 Tax=Chryseosolibacter indicus TaxID=2782351 RepID=A0ABS5VT88_9BACT|nr:nucleoside permease [Chryseosolibacter indicus]MBT1704411.1 nucleoside permease [Chryseosolibacter indicus]